jgi:hypothetical protein
MVTLCLALVVTNSHWLSDTLAGAGLGSVLGHAAVARQRRFGAT